MESVRRVLLWEMIRYYPELFFSLYCASRKMQGNLTQDLSYLLYYLEESHKCEGIREFSVQEAVLLLSSYLRSSTKLFNYTVGSKIAKVYDLETKQLISSEIEIDGDFNAPGSIYMNPSCFYLAGINQYSRSTYMINLPSFEVTKKADLIANRCGHAIIKY